MHHLVLGTAGHIDHVRSVAGIDHIGLGGDYDGTSSLPVGLEDVSKYPALVVELIERGYTDADVRKILGENASFFDNVGSSVDRLKFQSPLLLGRLKESIFILPQIKLIQVIRLVLVTAKYTKWH